METIRVQLKSDKSMLNIAESDYDPARHMKVLETIVDEERDDDAIEKLNTERDAVFTKMRTELDALVEGVQKTGERVDLLAQPASPIERTDLYGPEAMAYGQGLRATPRWEIRCDRDLSPLERKIMTPEAVYHSAMWMRAALAKDGATMAKIAREQLDRDKAIGIHVRAGQTTAATEGGELLPSPLANFIAVQRDLSERIAPRCQQFTSESKTLDVPQENAVGAVALIAEATSESDTLTATDSTFTQLQMTKKKYGRLARFTQELLDDQANFFDVVQFIARQTGRKLAVLHDTNAANASSTFTSALEDSGAIGTVVAGGTASIANVKKLYFGLPQEWREGGAGLIWMANDAVAEILSNLEDTSGREYFQIGAGPMGGTVLTDDGNQTGIMLGLQFLTVPFTANILMIGRLLEGYAILNDPNGAMRIDLNDSIYFKSDQLALRVLQRRDGAVIQGAAFVKTSAPVS